MENGFKRSSKNGVYNYIIIDCILQDGSGPVGENIEDGDEKKPRITASQLPVDVWHAIIGEQNIADAKLYKLVLTSHRINIKVKSMYKKPKKQ